ncbi:MULTISPECIES: DUF3095 domain-containing protein [Mesorhizobium]|uniref:DUF3095 domain-containing protein n=1 Tax=Mesorhizobium denitrificans TaxID=2294114 RepID=A0A371X3Y7_9HYPH|nr:MULTISPECIES: DUF3095 domain-containing protein [Mesorhizobium]RFC63945.1 DUF3095 domain-containing protein [Mesorhizobium denitrificans]
MDSLNADRTFLDTLPVFAAFENVTDFEQYRPLPADWVLAAADIVNSTQAIAAGRYKSVNTAGASVISALLNQSGTRDLPFVFGGDGALVALPPANRQDAEQALAAVQSWVAEELNLELRAALVPVEDVRKHGFDVRVARVQVSEHVTYAMFAGGGASWAESEMKAGHYRVAPAPAGSRPDLTGLSCRWDPIDARNGEIVSVIAVPNGADSLPGFAVLVVDLVALAGQQERGGHPIPLEGLHHSFPPRGLDIEARALAPKGHRIVPKLWILFQLALNIYSEKTGRSLGRFNAARYKRDVANNSDFRKFDDGLKMTIDVDAETLSKIEQRLTLAEHDGVCRFGIHRQKTALMTCIVATPLAPDHIHFVDGAAGGYAMAAMNLKSKIAA